MRDSDTDVPGAASTMQMDVGAMISMGPLSLSAAWANNDAANTDMFALGAGYPLGEGVDIEAQVDFGDNNGTDWVQFMVGTAISF